LTAYKVLCIIEFSQAPSIFVDNPLFPRLLYKIYFLQGFCKSIGEHGIWYGSDAMILDKLVLVAQAQESQEVLLPGNAIHENVDGIASGYIQLHPQYSTLIFVTDVTM
jgi:hypothetical protein